MEQDQATHSEDTSLVSTRTMDIATALFFIVLGALVIYDSVRIGNSWGDMGPESGYFPFYIGCLLIFGASLIILSAVLPGNKAAGDASFVTRRQIRSVIKVFIPTMIYVALMNYIGLYAAASLYIMGFMMLNGGYAYVRTLPYAIIVPILVYGMFEKWFLVPLPKGPIEAALGL
jgi:hypothetical protein